MRWNEQGAKGFVHRLVVTGSEVATSVMARVHPEESAPKVLGKDSDWLGTSHHLVIPVYQYDALHILCK